MGYSNMADLAVLKYHLGEYNAASTYFWRTTPFFGDGGWSLLELSMLVMYSDCLKRLERKDENVKVMLKLLAKAANAERDRQQSKLSLRLSKDTVEYPDTEVLQGFLKQMTGNKGFRVLGQQEYDKVQLENVGGRVGR